MPVRSVNSPLELRVRGARRLAVVALIREFGRPFTTEQLWKVCSQMPNPISRATLYRLLRVLREEGLLKDIFLPHGQQVSIYTNAATVCVVECSGCGLYADCPELSSGLASAIERAKLKPSLTAIFLRGLCPECSAGKRREMREKGIVKTAVSPPSAARHSHAESGR